MWRVGVLALFAAMLFAGTAFAADDLVIVGARVDALTGRLEISGENLMGPNGKRTPNVFLGRTALPLADPITPTSVIALLPQALPAGNYLLIVYATNNDKNTNHFYDTFDIAVPEIGPKGETGSPGIAGPSGPTGRAGAAGPQGPTGDAGVQGPTGPQGPQGETGPKAAQGPAGSQGGVGPQGPVGSQGPRGLQGPMGPIGPMGPAGEVRACMPFCS